MALIEDIEDIDVLATNLPSLLSDVQALVADFQGQSDAAAKVEALANGLAALSTAVAKVAAAIKANE